MVLTIDSDELIQTMDRIIHFEFLKHIKCIWNGKGLS